MLKAAALVPIILNRRNVGGMHAEYKGKHRYIKFAGKGQCDWWYILPDGSGRHGELEIKRPSGWPGIDQIRWMLSVNSAGGLACWVNSGESAVKVFDHVMRGYSIYMRESGEYSFTDMKDQCCQWNSRELVLLQRRILKMGGKL